MHEFSFQNKTAVITGGARGIGRCIAEEFVRHGAQVHVIDIAPGEHYVGDISDPAVLEAFVKEITRGGARIDYLINNALPEMHGIDDCSWEQFNYALQVGVAAPFYLTKLLPVVSIQPGEMELTRTRPARLTASAWVSAAMPPLAAV